MTAQNSCACINRNNYRLYQQDESAPKKLQKPEGPVFTACRH